MDIVIAGEKLLANTLKIVSGGQTGADRAALDWAIEHQVTHGGWCPKGRKAEDGVIIAVLVYARYICRDTACRAPTPWHITLYRI